MTSGSEIETGTIIQIVILLLLLILSGIFSSAETALTTVNKYKMKALEEEGNKRAKLVLGLIEDPGKMLSTILIGNNIVNLTASSLTTILATKIFGSAKIGIATGILTVLILIFGEITPKNLATIFNEQLAMFYAWPIRILSIVLTPVIWLLDKICNLIYRILRVDSSDLNKTMTESELRTIVNVSHEDGVIEPEEKDMITNVVDFGDSVAKDIMIPRANIKMAPEDATFSEIYALFQEEHYSRLPIYRENKENIVGILHMKDLFFYEFQNKGVGGVKGPVENFDVKDVMREPHYTYEFQKTSSILEELRENSLSITIVLDEYGCAAGMITLEDLLEEIVGEIRDEYDIYEEDTIKEISDGCYEIDGAAKIADVNDTCDLDLSSEDYDSIGGLMIELLEHLPEEGEVVTTGMVTFKILKADKTKVERLQMTIDRDLSDEEKQE